LGLLRFFNGNSLVVSTFLFTFASENKTNGKGDTLEYGLRHTPRGNVNEP